MQSTPLVGIVMGSRSDERFVQETVDVLDELSIPNEVSVLSAHRAPHRVQEYGVSAAKRGLEILIAAAGGSAALPGVLASWSFLPVIGIPLPTSELKGTDSLYAITQMPPGVPVACVAIGSWGARNAAYLAAGILSLKHPQIAQAYYEHREHQLIL